MKKNNIYILLISIICLLASHSIKAQSSLSVDASQLITSFKFKDSEGNKDKEYSGSYNGAYSIGYRKMNESGLIIRASIGMRNAGATLVYNETNQIWDFQYADIKAGAGYLFGLGTFRPYVTVTPYLGYLLKANQTIDDESFDIVDSESIERLDYGVVGSPGVQGDLSEFITAYLEFNYLMGLQNIETVDNGQKSTNVAYGLTAGVAFTIK